MGITFFHIHSSEFYTKFITKLAQRVFLVLLLVLLLLLFYSTCIHTYSLFLIMLLLLLRVQVFIVAK